MLQLYIITNNFDKVLLFMIVIVYKNEEFR